MRFLLYAVVAVVGYFLGNISTGLILGKCLAHVDIRTRGSGNAGTTNILRTLGWLPSLLTLAGDVLKAVLATLIGGWLLGEKGMYVGGVAVILGHNWPVLFGFKGGKGMACSLGAILVVEPFMGLALLAIQAVVLLITRYMSVASIVSALAYLLLVILLHPTNLPYIVFALILTALALFCHRSNMTRLLNHTENRLDFSRIKKFTKDV